VLLVLRLFGYLLDVFSASIKDGGGHHLHRRLFVVQSDPEGALTVRQPTIFQDLALAPRGTAAPSGLAFPERSVIEQALVEKALSPFLDEVACERQRETQTVSQHVEISLNEMIHRANLKLAELVEQSENGDTTPLAQANKKQAEDRVDELNGRLERRREELCRERECTIGDIQHVGRSWVLPHPDRDKPAIAPMVRDDQIERTAIQVVTALLRTDGWEVESVEAENRGFDLIARRPHPEDDRSVVVRFVEVKGRSGVGQVALTANEYKTAERLKADYWLYVVFRCESGKPESHAIQDPVRLGWEPLVKIEHYHVPAGKILEGER
jgi:hypothetical protein